MSTMTQGTLSYLLDEVVSAVMFDEAFREGAGLVTPALYSMREATGRRERIASFSALDSFDEKQETLAATDDEVVQQFQTTFVPIPYAKNVKFSREVAEDEEWGLIGNLASLMGQAFQQTIEDKGSDLFNDIRTGVSYKSEDNAAIAGTHTNSDGANSQSNAGSNSLTMAGVKASVIAARKLTNYRGNSKAKFKPDMLLVPVDLEVDSWEIVRSSLRPDNANEAANMFNNMMQLVVWDELTDTNAWALIDSMKMMRNLLWLWRSPFEVYSSGDLFVGTRRVGAYFRSKHGCVDWRWVYHNNPS